MAVTRWTQNIFNKSCNIVAGKLTIINMRSGVVKEYNRWIGPNVVVCANVAMNGAVNRAELDYTAYSATSLDKVYVPLLSVHQALESQKILTLLNSGISRMHGGHQGA